MHDPRYGYLLDLIISLRAHGVPLFALNLNFFTEPEQRWIENGYQVSLGTLMGGERVDA